jgi:DNA-directed RNA polymerase subunit alpha
MEQAGKGVLDEIVSRETWTFEDQKELLNQLYQVKDAPRRFRSILENLEAADGQPKGGSALKIGIANYMLCRFGRALEVFSNATDNKERRFFQALCYKCLRQYDKALEDLDRAKDRGWDALAVETQIVEVKALAGDLEGARKGLSRLEKHSATADYRYLAGLIEELSGNDDKASALYAQVRQTDPNHGAATFRLAYYLDLHGEEEQAIELYRHCLNHPPVFANALLNLAVLYEDMGRYDHAISCLRRVLVSMPNHPRARLFIRDAEASKVMFYDEDQAKRVAKRNAVLDIPVTDFELSVRARNCLKKMNVRSLGDLVRTSETELLGYKNFGETSLKEIKDMLSIKGLHLGQGSEEENPLEIEEILDEVEPPPAEAPVEAPAPGQDQGVLATPIAQLDFSIRARKALEGLNVVTLGDLSNKSEAELLGCKNFGQTSLNEITQRLSEHGLRLKESV